MTRLYHSAIFFVVLMTLLSVSAISYAASIDTLKEKAVEWAVSQLGKTDGPGYIEDYNKLSDDDKGKKEAYSTVFVELALYNGGIKNAPMVDKASALHSWAKTKSVWHAKSSSYVPTPGDIVLFSNNGKKASHAEIVENVLQTGELISKGGNTSESTDKLYILECINGNAVENGKKQGTVKRVTYKTSDSYFGCVEINSDLLKENAGKKKAVEWALSQLGKKKGPKYIKEFNKIAGTHKGTSEAYCTVFAELALYKAGVRTGPMKTQANKANNWAKDKGLWHKKGSSYIPQPGDIVQFSGNGKKASHTELVVCTKVEDGKTIIHTVNGNNRRTVRRKERNAKSDYYFGCIEIPD